MSPKINKKSEEIVKNMKREQRYYAKASSPT